MASEATCLLDLFSRVSHSRKEVNVLRSAVMYKDLEKRAPPGQEGCWDKIMKHKYKPYMPKYVTRRFHALVYDEEISQDLVYMHIIFFVMVAREPSVQTIIAKQLQRAGDHDRLHFFQNVFIQQARLYTNILFEYSHTPDNAKCALVMVTTELCMAWALQDSWKYEISREATKLAIQQDIQAAKDNKLAQAQLKVKTGRKKRRKTARDNDNDEEFLLD